MSTLTAGDLTDLRHEIQPERARRRPVGWRAPVLLIVKILLALLFGLPLVFMIVSSFKPDLQIFADLNGVQAFLPVGDLTLDNYLGVFERVPFAQFLLNSVMISVITVGLGIIVNSLAAFAMARMRLPGRKWLLGIVLATLIVPFEVMALPCCGG